MSHVQLMNVHIPTFTLEAATTFIVFASLFMYSSCQNQLFGLCFAEALTLILIMECFIEGVNGNQRNG